MSSIYLSSRNSYLQDSWQDQAGSIEKDLTQLPLFANHKTDGIAKEIFATWEVNGSRQDQLTPEDAEKLIFTAQELSITEFRYYEKETAEALMRLIFEKLCSYGGQLNLEHLYKIFSLFWENFLEATKTAHAISFLHNLANSHLQIATVGIRALLTNLVFWRYTGVSCHLSNQEFTKFIDSLLHICKKIPLEVEGLGARLIATASGACSWTRLDTSSMQFSKQQYFLLARLILESICSYDIENLTLEHLKNVAGNNPYIHIQWDNVNAILEDVKKDYQQFQLLRTLMHLEGDGISPYALPKEVIQLIKDLSW